MAFKLRNPFAAKTVDKASPELMEREGPNDMDSDADGARKSASIVFKDRGAVEREGGVIIKDLKTNDREAGGDGHSADDVDSEAAPDGMAARVLKQKTKSNQSNDRLDQEDDPAGVDGDGSPAEAKVVLGGIKTSEESFRVADGGRSGDGSGDGPAGVVQYNESDLQRESGGGGDMPEPDKSANLNLSKSNINRAAGPENDGDSPDAPAAMATNLNSSRSNVYRAGGGGGGGADEPSEATINTTKSNTFGTGGAPAAGDSGPGLPEPVEASNLNLSKSDISLGRHSDLSTRGTVGDISLKRTGSEAPAGDGGPGDPAGMEKGTVKFFNEKKEMAAGADDAQARGPVRLDPTPARAAGEDGGGAPEAAINTSHSNIKNMDATEPTGDAPGGADALRHDTVKNSIGNIRRETGPSAPVEGKPTKDQVAGEDGDGEPSLATTVKSSKSNSSDRVGGDGGGSDASAGGGASGADRISTKEPTKVEVPNLREAGTMCAACGAYLGGALHCPSCGADHDPERIADADTATGESDPTDGDDIAGRSFRGGGLRMNESAGRVEVSDDGPGAPLEHSAVSDSGDVHKTVVPQKFPLGRGEVSDDGPGTPLEHIAVSDSGVVSKPPPKIKREADPGTPTDDNTDDDDLPNRVGVRGWDPDKKTPVAGSAAGGGDAMTKEGPLAAGDPGGGAADAKVSMQDFQVMREGGVTTGGGVAVDDEMTRAGAPVSEDQTRSLPRTEVARQGPAAGDDADQARKSQTIYQESKEGPRADDATDQGRQFQTLSNASKEGPRADDGMTRSSDAVAADGSAGAAATIGHEATHTVQQSAGARVFPETNNLDDAPGTDAAAINKTRSNSYRTADSDSDGDQAPDEMAAGGGITKSRSNIRNNREAQDNDESEFAINEPGVHRDAGSGLATGKAVGEKDHGSQVAESNDDGLAIGEEGVQRMSGKIALVREQAPDPGDASIAVPDDGGLQAAAAGEQKKWLPANFRTAAADPDDDGPSTLLDLSSVDASGAVAPIGDPDFDLLASAEALDPDSDADGIDVDPDADADAVEFEEALITD